MHRFRFALAALALALTLAPAAAQARPRAAKRVVATKASDCSGTNLLPSPDNLDAIRSATLCLINVERTQRGRLPLRTNVDLTQVAGLYSRAMIDYSFFGHLSPAGSTFISRIKRTDYLTRTNGWAVGENLAWGEVELGSPAKTVEAWMLSPEHKRNILDTNYVEIGIGVAYGTPGDRNQQGATYATEFGTRSLIVSA
ncbi:MAG TPA: CAP domain-containing protein [Solirubrobacteraceae bacterium]|nr:CAP domain-containing protein [Solirubrobacteraceae bacterium]